jgi:16S rRNA (adenine1518-N6/adenine1519-N6)-dimethyltransferase
VTAPSTPTAIRGLLAAHGVRPSRALGQNFLADANTARRIVRLAEVHPGDRVIEVGAGLGSLTVELARAGASVTAVELDRHLLPVLAETTAGLDVRIVHADALKVDWTEVLGGATRWSMVSNLPYNVATPLLVEMLEHAPMVDRYLVMVQREVGERLAARAGSEAYGAVSVKIAYFARAEIVGRVPPTVFVPRPRVESVLVRLSRHARPPVDVPAVERLFAVVNAGFATRRKTLRNALRPLLGDRAEEALSAAGIDPGARAETVDLARWAALAREVHS